MPLSSQEKRIFLYCVLKSGTCRSNHRGSSSGQCMCTNHCPSLPSLISLPPSLPCFTKPNATMSSSSSSTPTSTSSIPSACSWSISEDSLRRYVSYASESCVQELLSASDSSRAAGGGDDGWKVLTFEDGVEISRRRSGSPHVFRSRWLLRSVSPQQFITVATAIDAAKQWDPDLVEGRYIKDLNDNLSIISLRFGDASKSLFKNREFIVYERRESMDDGTLWPLYQKLSLQGCNQSNTIQLEGYCYSPDGWWKS